MNDVKNAAVENIANVIDILDCSIASKKVIQCKAIIRPGKENFIANPQASYETCNIQLIRSNFLMIVKLILGQFVNIHGVIFSFIICSSDLITIL